MRAVVAFFPSRGLARVAGVGLLSAVVVGCSGDTTRFGDGPFSNPYASRGARSEVTGSVPPAQAAPVGRVEKQPLQYGSSQSLPPPGASRPATISTNGQTGGGYGTGSYNPATTAPAPEVTGSVRQPPPPTRPAQSSWNWDGGTAIVVGPGETANSLSRKYGVPASAILQANGFSSASAIQPGRRIVIPRYNLAQPASPRAAAPVAPAAAPAPAPRGHATASPSTGAGSQIHVVAPGETLIAIARKYKKPLTEVAAANRVPPHSMVKIGDRIVIPGRTAVASTAPVPARVQTLATVPAPATPPRAAAQARPQPVPAGPQVASIATPTVRVATPASAVNDDEGASVSTNGGAPMFRWPVRGRIIAAFGAKPNGQQNDGINLAVPEGTAIRAAEDGVVAYAGNELKGYGNLILVRHANGFVTAYAHASEIMVKRNDQVRRGQVIAKSGQSGTVSSPQLHFEIRKGSAPVDPAQYLPAG